MRLGKVRLADGSVTAVLVGDDGVQPLSVSLSDVLHASDPAALARSSAGQSVSTDRVTFLAPIDAQEVWAAGVTYKRSEEARKRESVGAAVFYDKVYTADRPELFFKATPARVIRPGDAVRVRRDSRWSVPEPELALVVSPTGRVVGYTVGNDMSARDIEGENPLYLPQAKLYDQSCSLGPVITLAAAMPPADSVTISMRIERKGSVVFDGSTPLTAMKRTPEELVGWLYRDNSFPTGAILFTGTGIVPPDEFTLANGDLVRIGITGIGELVNPVVQG